MVEVKIIKAVTHSGTHLDLLGFRFIVFLALKHLLNLLY